MTITTHLVGTFGIAMLAVFVIAMGIVGIADLLAREDAHLEIEAVDHDVLTRR